MASWAPPPPPPSKFLDLDLTIVSAKHLKNVNWKNGDLKPYVVFWVHPDHRLATKSDDSGSTAPVWNERFILPLPSAHSLRNSFLTLEIFHSKPPDTPKPLVGSLRLPLNDLDYLTRLRKFTLTRPSGRPHGKIHLKLGLLARPLPAVDYVSAYLSSTAIPPQSARDYRGYSPSPSPSHPPYSSYSSYQDAYSGYYSGYFTGAPPAPPPPRPFLDRPVCYAGPSAPLDYSSHDQKPRSGKMGMGAGLTVGSVAGAPGGVALEEGVKYEDDKFAESVASNMAPPARDDYTRFPR